MLAHVIIIKLVGDGAIVSVRLHFGTPGVHTQLYQGELETERKGCISAL